MELQKQQLHCGSADSTVPPKSLYMHSEEHSKGEFIYVFW